MKRLEAKGKHRIQETCEQHDPGSSQEATRNLVNGLTIVWLYRIHKKGAKISEKWLGKQRREMGSDILSSAHARQAHEN